MLKPLFDPGRGRMRVVGLMSGSGSNLARILEYQRALDAAGDCPYRVVAIFSDNAASRALELGRDFDLPVVVRDKRSYYRARGKPLRDMAVRAEFDAETVAALAPFEASCAAYAGYMSIATPILVGAFLGVNVHPGDLSLRDEHGARILVGDRAVHLALSRGEARLRSSTHLISGEVDGGALLMRSAPLVPEWPEAAQGDADAAARHNQERLKEHGDWVIFPRTLEELARGRFARDASGLMHYDGRPIPDGVALE